MLKMGTPHAPLKGALRFGAFDACPQRLEDGDTPCPADEGRSEPSMPSRGEDALLRDLSIPVLNAYRSRFEL